MQCGETQRNGNLCQRDARVKVRRNGQVDWRYTCNTHLNRAVRKLMQFNSPMLLEIGCQQ